MDSLREIDTFLETYNIPKLNHDKIENLNRLITSQENESVIKNLPTNKNPELDGFTGEFYIQRINTSPYQTLPKNSKKETLPNSFYEANITLIPIPKTPQERKLQANIPDEHRCKNTQQNICKPNSIVY